MRRIRYLLNNKTKKVYLLIFVTLIITFGFALNAYAHGDSFCVHGSYYANGWESIYEGHTTFHGHWHEYSHRFLDYNGNWIKHHTEVNSCPN